LNRLIETDTRNPLQWLANSEEHFEHHQQVAYEKLSVLLQEEITQLPQDGPVFMPAKILFTLTLKRNSQGFYGMDQFYATDDICGQFYSERGFQCTF
jgi:hypothetical protein